MLSGIDGIRSRARLLTFFDGHWQLVHMVAGRVFLQAGEIDMNLAKIEFRLLLENQASGYV